jgi:hypothetical protein
MQNTISVINENTGLYKGEYTSICTVGLVGPREVELRFGTRSTRPRVNQHFYNLWVSWTQLGEWLCKVTKIVT